MSYETHNGVQLESALESLAIHTIVKSFWALYPPDAPLIARKPAPCLSSAVIEAIFGLLAAGQSCSKC